MSTEKVYLNKTLKVCKELGWTITKCTQYDAQRLRAIDLFGIADLIGVYPNRQGTVYIQVTAGGNGNARFDKIVECREKEAVALLRAGNEIEIWDWKRYKPRGQQTFWDAKRWRLDLLNGQCPIIVRMDLLSANEILNEHDLSLTSENERVL